MFILNDILSPLQKAFSSTDLGRQRSRWFAYTVFAFIIPFTNSISSNVFRCINTLFGLNVSRRRFYTFMASSKLPWGKLWPTLWSMIPNPLSDGRLLIALDDFINPKTGRKIFGCSHIFDHAAKANQSKYPWAQNAEMAARFISHASIHRVFLYGKYRDVNAFSKTVILKTLKCPVRVVWVFRKTQWIALFSTDLDLSVVQIIEYYGARWKIESGFKEIKQDIGSSKSQTRNAHAVINHIHFSMKSKDATVSHSQI